VYETLRDRTRAMAQTWVIWHCKIFWYYTGMPRTTMCPVWTFTA